MLTVAQNQHVFSAAHMLWKNVICARFDASDSKNVTHFVHDRAQQVIAGRGIDAHHAGIARV
jgi:hypothetical protein